MKNLLVVLRVFVGGEFGKIDNTVNLPQKKVVVDVIGDGSFQGL